MSLFRMQTPYSEARRHKRASLGAVLVLLLALAPALPVTCQTEGRAALDAFLEWKRKASPQLPFGEALEKYQQKLRGDGLSQEASERTIRLIVAYDEAELYDRVYAAPPEFNTSPNQLLVEAVRDVPPGKALDVGMGQGRNSLFLAARGWDVTGFDVAEVGLEKARTQAAASGLRITAVHASDEEFDFGRTRWDLIAIIYAIEKRSVHRVREALKPGGLVVVEAGHSETSGAPFEYQSNELLQIFEGFRILRYEDTGGTYDWGPETIRLVRLVAQKLR